MSAIVNLRASRADTSTQTELKSALRDWSKSLSAERITLWLVDKVCNHHA